MQIYLVKGYLDVAATSLEDAQALIIAMANPVSAINANTIARVTSKLPTLVQSDGGEPLVISSIDDAAGTISSWVTDPLQQVNVGLGNLSTAGGSTYASELNLSVSGSTRVGSLALNTIALANAIRLGPCCYLGSSVRGQFAFQIQRVAVGGATETMALFALNVTAAVLPFAPSEIPVQSYLTVTSALGSYVQNRTLVGIASVVSNPNLLCGIATANTIPAGAKVIAAFPNDTEVLFELVPTTATAAGFIFQPWDYLSANPLKWRLRGVWILGQPAIYNNDTGLWHYLVGVGASGAASVSCDQTGTALPS